jgi:hypothetical protein
MSVDLTIESVQCELTEFARRHRIDLPTVGERFALGDPRGGGSYGGIHVVSARNGQAPRTPLVAKLFDLRGKGVEDAEVVDRVTGLHAGLSRGGSEVLDGLLAIPFSLVETRVDGALRLVAFMLDLTQLGYKQVPYEKAEEFKRFIKGASLGERIDFAYSYARCAALLERIGFTHGDQNLQNLMVNEQTAEMQLIDFDMGALVVNGDEQPRIEGKADEFVPIEVKGDGLGLNKGPHTPAAERWSVGVLIGTLLFGLNPIFFLRNVSANSVEEYAATGSRWPAIDVHKEPFGAGNEQSYARFRGFVEASIPSAIVLTFADFFAAGVDGERRPTAADWVTAIDSARQPPQFLQTRLSSLLVLEGTEVTVNWRTDNAERVESPLLGRLDPNGEANVPVGAGTQVRLTAINRWGDVSWTSPVVQTVPLPRISAIPVPDFPGLSIHVETPWPEFPLADANPFPTAPPFDRAFLRPRGRIAGAGLDGPAIPNFPPIPDVFSAPLVPPLRMPPGWRLPKSKREERRR